MLARHLKVGSVIVREHQGKVQEVMVMSDGFCWQGRVYTSLSTIARKITGASWNGPRFFGLRGGEPAPSAAAGPQRAAGLSARRAAPGIDPCRWTASSIPDGCRGPAP